MKVGGSKQFGAALVGAFLISFNMQSQPEILKVISPGAASHEGNSVVTDDSDFVYLVGQHTTTEFRDGVRLGSLLGEEIETFGSTDFFVAKFTPDLEPLWVRGAGSLQFDFGTVVRVASDGSVVVCGAYQKPMSFFGQELPYGNFADTFVARFSATGDLLWVQTINGNEDVIADGLALDEQDNIYLSGRLRHVAMFGDQEVGDRFQNRAFLSKLDPNGQFVFSKVVTGSSGVGAVVAHHGHDGRIYVAGTHGGGSKGVFVSAFSSAGDQVFLHGYAGGGQSEISDIELGKDGHLYVCGRFTDATLDLNGTVLNNPTDFFSGFLAKLKVSGESVWAMITGERGMQLVLDSQDTVYLSGYYKSDITSIGSVSLDSVGELDAYVAAVSSQGDVQWALPMASGIHDRARTITMDSKGSLLIAGEASHDAFGVAPLGGTVFLAKTQPVSGNPPVDDTPALSIEWVDGHLQISWDPAVTGYQLEATINLLQSFDVASDYIQAVEGQPNTFQIQGNAPALFLRLTE